ncbi:MAG: initiation factor 2B [Anaerolineae bacterium]
MTWRDQQAKIMIDKVSGAVDLTQATARMLLDFATDQAGKSVDDLLASLQQVGREILTAQSGMSSLVSLFNRVFFAISAEFDPDAVPLVVRETVHAFLREQEDAQNALRRKAAALLPANVCVLTHSSSSTVYHTLLNARKAGRNPRVICLEARPLYEGRQQAKRLADSGIQVTLIVDSAAYANLRDVELVLVGADSLTGEGVVSKVGTAGLAVCAQSLGIPCYFLADTTKLWPAALGEQPIHERAPQDVWPDAPENIRIQNRFFDVTPWSAIAGVVTEYGLLSAEEVQAQSQDRPVHRLLQDIVAEVRSTV